MANRDNPYPKYPAGNFASARDWHVYFVYNDPDFVAECVALDRMSPQNGYAKIASKYAITPYDVFFFDIRKKLYLSENLKRKGALSFDPSTKKFMLTFDFTITRAEFLEFWDKFSSIQEALTQRKHSNTKKRKPPENPELLYAIFKARSKSNTFSQIFTMYSTGQLPHYLGSTGQFKSEDSLERYYSKYKPGKQPGT